MADGESTDVDAVTGTATTGHVWDGIRELNTPLPRWWLWLFYATIVWSIGYWIVYPSWPLVTLLHQRLFDWHSREAVVSDLDALKAQRGPMVGQLAAASLQEIARRPAAPGICARAGPAGLRRELRAVPRRRRRRRQGLSEPERRRLALGRQARRHRPDHPPRRPLRRRQGRQGAVMPAFGRDGILKRADIENVADYVRSLAGLPVDPKADLAAGKKVFADSCVTCHGADGKGNRELGAPNLTDASGSTAPTRRRSSRASGTAAAA